MEVTGTVTVYFQDQELYDYYHANFPMTLEDYISLYLQCWDLVDETSDTSGDFKKVRRNS